MWYRCQKIFWHQSIFQAIKIYWLIQAQKKVKGGWLSQVFLPGCYNKGKRCKWLMFEEWMKWYCVLLVISLLTLQSSYWLFNLKDGPQSLVTLFLKTQRKLHCGKVSKCRVFSGSYFPVNTEIYGVQSKYRKQRTRKNSLFRLFSWSVRKSLYSVWIQQIMDQKKPRIWNFSHIVRGINWTGFAFPKGHVGILCSR